MTTTPVVPASGFIDPGTPDQLASAEESSAKAPRTPPKPRQVPKAADLRKDPVALHVYEGKDGWRWSLVAGNGPKVGDGGQGYQGTRARVVDFVLRFVRFDKAEYSDEPCKRHSSTSGKCRIFPTGDASLGTPAGR